jgi:glycosyltransferase involved in cell wall biosynthesis
MALGQFHPVVPDVLHELRGLCVKVLYLQPAAAFGGSSKSLIELYRVLKRKGIEGSVLTPPGAAAQAFSNEEMEVLTVRGLSQFDNTRYGYYRRLRWIIMLRELLLLPFTLGALWRLRRRDFDLIHLNDITLLPVGLIAKVIFKIPLVVHVRSVQRDPVNGIRSWWLNCLLKRYAAAVIAIDHTVAESLDQTLPISVVHNGLQLDGAPIILPAARDPSESVKVGFLGVLIRMKGIYEFVEAAKILVKERRLDVEFLIAGENARNLSGFKARVLKLLGFAEDVESDLVAQIERDGLRDHVKLLGFVDDPREIYERLDILCFPSHLNAAGRPVFEAAFFGVPSVVAIREPVSDAILHDLTGLAIAQSEPGLLADALELLIRDAPYRLRLGHAAQAWARDIFDIEKSAEQVVLIYRSLVLKM